MLPCPNYKERGFRVKIENTFAKYLINKTDTRVQSNFILRNHLKLKYCSKY